MAQIPFELQKLPPAALDVLRYFAQNGNQPADDIEIIAHANLTERSFSKAIKRLITKKFADMDVRRMYTLTEKGEDLMHELVEYDRETGGGSNGSSSPASSAPVEAQAIPQPTEPVSNGVGPVQCRLTVVVPEPLLVGEETQVYVGIDDRNVPAPADVVLRLSVINGEASKQEDVIQLRRGAAHQAFYVTAGEFRQTRLRVQAFQSDAFSGDLHLAGGLYVDVDVTKDENENGLLAAFGTDVTVLPG